MNSSQLSHWVAVSSPVFIGLCAFLGWPFVSAVLSMVLRKGLPTQWEEKAKKNPRLALMIDLLHATGLSLDSVVRSFQGYALRKAGGSVLPDMKELVKDPQKRHELEAALEEIKRLESQRLSA